MSLSTVARSVGVEAILERLLFSGTYKPEPNMKKDIEALSAISPTLTGEYATNGFLVFFAVDPPLSVIREMERNLDNSTTTKSPDLLVFLHVSEAHMFNKYFDLQEERPNEEGTELRFLANMKKASDDDLKEYLYALNKFTSVLCTKVPQWTHIMLVLPPSVCKSLGDRLLAETGDAYPDTRSLTTFGLNQVTYTWVPEDNRYDSATCNDTTMIREVYSKILKAPGARQALRNLFFHIMRTRTMQLLEAVNRNPPVTGARDMLDRLGPIPEPQLVSYLSDLSLSYIHVTLPTYAVDVRRIFDSVKDTLGHAVVSLVYDPFTPEDHAELHLPKLRSVNMKFGQYGVMAQVQAEPPIGLLSGMKLSAVKEMNLVFQNLPQPPSQTSDPDLESLDPAIDVDLTCEKEANYIIECIGAAVNRQQRSQCFLRVGHFDNGVVRLLQNLVDGAGWSQTSVCTLGGLE